MLEARRMTSHGGVVSADENTSTSDVYFAADVETDGPIPGPFSMLSFALVEIGAYDGSVLRRPNGEPRTFYSELKPISDDFQAEALAVNGIDRARLLASGPNPEDVMDAAQKWIRTVAGKRTPVLVAYPLAFDWSWLYWYFTRFSSDGSPFNHSRCFDLKTAFAVKAHRRIGAAGRDELPPELRALQAHTHNALDDARELAEIFVKLTAWEP